MALDDTGGEKDAGQGFDSDGFDVESPRPWTLQAILGFSMCVVLIKERGFLWIWAGAFQQAYGSLDFVRDLQKKGEPICHSCRARIL